MRFQEISSPSHENYGQHFDRDELSALLAPTEEAKSVAMTWLEEGDIVDVQDDGDFLLFRYLLPPFPKISIQCQLKKWDILIRLQNECRKSLNSSPS